MRVSDLVVVNDRYRAYRKAITLIKSMQTRSAYLEKVGALSYVHKLRAEKLTQELNEFARLDINKFKCNTPLSDYILPKAITQPVRETMLYVFEGAPEPTPAVHDDQEAEICAHMADTGRKSRAGYFTYLVKAETALRAAQGWYLVFNTLTVDDDNYNSVFDPKSTHFVEYVRRIDRAVAQATYGSVRQAKGQDYHSYFGVVEAGGRTGRLHIHVLHFMKKLPEGTQDPNTGRAVPDQRELSNFKPYWTLGFSTPIAVRYSLNDAFGLSGFRWPIDRKTGKGLNAKSPFAISGYMAKYVMKAYQSEERSEYKWRVKKSRKFGTTTLKMALERMNNKALEILADLGVKFKMFETTIPPGMVRQESLKILQGRLSTKLLFEAGMDTKSRPSPLQQWRDLTLTKGIPSSPSTTPSQITGISEQDLSDTIGDFTEILRYTEELVYVTSSKVAPSLFQSDSRR